MKSIVLTLPRRHRYIAGLTVALIVAGLVLHPARTLLGAWHFAKADDILNADSAGFEDVLKVPSESIDDLQAALRSMERARRYDPEKTQYRRAIAGAHGMIGKWAQTMESLHAEVLPGVPPPEVSFGRSHDGFTAIVDDEPTNADHHLALAQVLAEVGTVEEAAAHELEAAVALYPVNSSIRLAVATRYLIMGMEKEALEQARKLAKNDDSYIIPETTHGKIIREQRSAEYRAVLASSYLIKALEIIWRASGKNVTMLRSAIPDNAGARDTVELFLESKGIMD